MVDLLKHDDSFTPPPQSTLPAVSVIIPMFNVEKYIGELLDSLLAQTFENFEVIVVDDCSTDNSAAVVESYIPKFNGRLLLNKLKTNSGGEAKPRNVGLTLAQGEYVFFVDSDDFILLTALETLYKTAKEYEADVVYTSAYYDLRNPNDVYLIRDGKGLSLLEEGLEDKIELTVDAPDKLLQALLIKNPPSGNHRTAWTKFVQRKLLIENHIDFASIPVSPDYIWVINLYCHAKRFVRISTPLYFYRDYNTSITRAQKKPSEQISKWIAGFVAWARCLGELQRENKVLSENLAYSLAALQGHFGWVCNCIKEVCGQLSNKEIYEILCNKFAQEKTLQDLTIPFFFSLINADNKIKTEQSNVINHRDTEIKQLKEKIGSLTPLPALKKDPAVSVIIPMYNVEKYVGECLDSLLAQTFLDFEVIVVDDCSTDNSVAIVENYMPRFNGRLQLAKTEKNSGRCAVPRNVGFPLACGEYVYFFDADDTITPTALEEMYTFAKEYDADVVQCEKWYDLPDEFYHDDEYRKKLKPFSWPTMEKIFITQPTLLASNVEERVADFCERKWLTWSIWLQMIRRDFLIENQLSFANVYAEDLPITLCELACAKRYLVIPSVCVFYRLRKDSIVREDTKDFSAEKLIHKYALTLKRGINYLDDFLSRQEIFSQRPDLKYMMFNFFLDEIKFRIDRIYDQFPSHTLDKFLQKEFGDGAFEAFLFNTMNTFRRQFEQYRRQSEQYQKQLSTFNQFTKNLPKDFYAVSVIIPLYNAEKYIGELLDSILAQTFQNFEVIVVDDCSTDSSVAIVESYKEKFGGRLKLTKTEKNTGSPGEPGNLGVDLSRGEYLFILDNDDAITPDALEKLYTAAKKFDADVVACEWYYDVPEESWHDEAFRKNLEPFTWPTAFHVKEPTLIPFDVAKRVQDCWDRKFIWMLWVKLIRRDYLIKNKIRFTKNLIQDMLSTCCMLYSAEKYVVVPYAVNFYRVRKNSLYHLNRKPLDQMKTYLSVMNIGLKYLDDFLSKREFFQQNPELKNFAFKIYFNETWQMYIQPVYSAIPAHEREETLRKELAGFDNIALATYLLDAVTKLNFAHDELKAVYDNAAAFIDRLKNFVTGRVDIQLVPKNGKGDLQIVSVSDSKAQINKSTWLPKNTVGYFINSRVGKMKLVAKATVDGKIKLELKSLWVRNPDDKSKLIPYWIDFTKLIVNGEIIFNKLTPAWHDVPFNYSLDVKAGEEIEVQTEWLPHRVDVQKFEPPPPEKIIEPIDKKFLPYLTARIDAKLTGGDFKIISVSDKKAAVWKPDWLQKDGVGYQINSHAGNLELVAKVTANGQLRLNLLSMDIRDPDNKSKRIPYWIDYTKLVINGKAIFDKAMPAWHDEPFSYTQDVKANEEITLQVEWLPHKGEVSATPQVTPPIVDKFLPYLTARLDAKLTTAAGGDFQILSLSDDKATVWKPKWLQKGGVGYQIQSLAGNMKLVAKAISAGQLRLKLMSLDIYDPDDKSKRIPYWIDYNKLIINGETILDEATPAWHDEPFIYNLDVKADEEITLDVEWLPHMGEVPKIEPPTVEKVVEPIVDKFLPYLTARLDAKLTTEGGDFKIISLSDDKAAVKKPAFLQKGGVGYVIQSHAGNMKLVAKATSNGQFNLKLRSLWVPNPDDNSKLIPYWIDYNKLVINGEVIFDKATPAWHDEPFIYDLDVKADEEITLDVEWLPHMGEVPKIAPPPPQVEPPVNKFSTQQHTARLDVKLTTEEGGDFQILSISDDKAEIKKPDWLQKGGVGYVIQSFAGEMNLVAKATSNGQLSLKLRSLWVPNPDDNSKLIPYWIDYTKLIVNGKVILDKATPAWHDEPFIYTLDVKADEEIALDVEWLPHKSDT